MSNLAKEGVCAAMSSCGMVSVMSAPLPVAILLVVVLYFGGRAYLRRAHTRRVAG